MQESKKTGERKRSKRRGKHIIIMIMIIITCTGAAGCIHSVVRFDSVFLRSFAAHVDVHGATSACPKKGKNETRKEQPSERKKGSKKVSRIKDRAQLKM